MSRSIGTELPPRLRAALAGDRLEDVVELTFLLLSADEQARVSVAMLSVGEILAVDDRRLRFALWPGTTTVRNLRRARTATLVAVDPNGSFYVRLDVRAGPALISGGMHHATFDAIVDDVLTDDVSYAQIETGITISMPQQDAVLARWRDTIAGMRALADD